MKALLPFIVFLCGSITLTLAQPQLQPSIGLTAQPQDADPVCPIQIYTGSFNNSGLQEGDTIPHFKLFSLNGDSLDIAVELSLGKPILLIAGSYTCPVFRNKVQNINNVVANYDTAISTFIIYTVEAHPDIDVSPYSGTVWTTSQNINSNILYQQPQNYAQRKAVVSDMLNTMTINAPVFIDGPCNEWWNTFGPAPNNAYLINTDGIVFSKHPWYNQAPKNIAADIDSLLNGTGGGGIGVNGTFTFSYDVDSIIYGPLLTIVTVYALLSNNTNADAEMDIIRIENNLPGSWQSSLCTDICLAPSTDSTYLYLSANSSQSFSMHYYTDAIPATGNSLILFKNRNVLSNNLTKRFYGTTDNTIISVTDNAANIQYNLYPNPALSSFIIQSDASDEYTLYSFNGKEILNGFTNTYTDISHLKPGYYFVKIQNNQYPVVLPFVKTIAY